MSHFDYFVVAPMVPLTTSIETFSEQPHAVKTISHTTGIDRYEYDGNGNMTFRVELSGTQPITYHQEFDVENRLSAVTVTDGITQTVTRFAYDGDGALYMKVAPDGAVTAYLGQYFEVEISGGSTVTTNYYYHAGRRVAMRTGGEVYYLYGDHLGSTSLTTNDTGGSVVRQLYHPYGTVRWSSGTLPTDFTFTGQRTDYYIDMLTMGARWYEGRIGRWLSADTIVPDPANPQALNRYAYVYNSPANYTDPTGHMHWPGNGGEPNPERYLAPRDYYVFSPEQRAYIQEHGHEPTPLEYVAFYGGALGLIAVSAWALPTGAVAEEFIQVSATTATALCADGDCKNEVETLGKTAKQAFGSLSRASEYGIQTYRDLSNLIERTGLEAYHIIENRLARTLGLPLGEMPTVAVTREEHQILTNLWRNAIGYVNSRAALTTDTATLQQVWEKAQVIYADTPALLEAARQALFGP